MSRSRRVDEWSSREFRKALGVSVGDSVVIELKDGELRLPSLDAAIKRARRRSGNTSRRESRWLTS
jgi:hypothetical protein